MLTNLRISDKTTLPYINSDTGDAEISLALFQDGAVIKNLGIGKGSSITYQGVEKRLTLKVYAAAIAVGADEIDNCFSDATVTVKGKGDAVIGGVAVRAGKITNSYNRGAIYFEGNVIDSRAKNRRGTITPGPLKVGGVCAEPDKKISGCYNTGSITIKASAEDLKIGGVAAEPNNSDCADLYNTGKISVIATGDIKNAFIGGVLGYGLTYRGIIGKPIRYVDSGYIYNKGNVDVTIQTGKFINVGGIGGGGKGGFNGSTVGFGGVYGFLNTYNTGSISVSSTGKVSGLRAGGIAGYGSMIINSYNTGVISGNSGAETNLQLGGLGGEGVYVQNSYNIGQVSGKGSGTNVAGGIMGRADVRWGETDKTLYAALNGFWLKQSKAGGINSDIKYGKGSYYYKNKKDIKKDGLGEVLDVIALLDKKNAESNTMIEDSFGPVYSFDSATAAAMTRTDDGTGKRANLNGTLLDNLNQMVEDKSDRMYRRWVIDGTNGGYPVLSSKPAIFSNNDEKPDASVARQIAGQYLGEHKQWTDNVLLNADGTFKRANGGDGGTWSLKGRRLLLRWSKWAPEILEEKSAGVFSSNVYNFTLTRSGVSTSTDKTDAATAKNIAGVYNAEHRYWTDNITISADGTFKRASGGDGGTWSFDGKKLLLKWSKWAPEILEQKSEGAFSSKIYRFKLTRTGTSASDTSPTVDKPAAVSATAKKIAGVYYAQHKDWTGSIIINVDGTFQRDSKGDGGTWSFDGRKLVLMWSKAAPETLLPSATGFYCPGYKFTLRR